ncbi:MAG: hypothetical protein OWT27_07490, partial [Firmicutes bacterium]|nr:hypothetical protein [Bacillota bacterium]
SSRGGVWLALYRGRWLLVNVPPEAFSVPTRVLLTTTSHLAQVRSLLPSGQHLLLALGLQSWTTPKRALRLTVVEHQLPENPSVAAVDEYGALTRVASRTSTDRLSWMCAGTGQWVVAYTRAATKITTPKGWGTIAYPGSSGSIFTVPVPVLVRNNAINGKRTAFLPVAALDDVLRAMGLNADWRAPVWDLSDPHAVSYTDVRLLPDTSAQLQINGDPVLNFDSGRAHDALTGRSGTVVPVWYLLQALRRTGVKARWTHDQLVL